MKKHTGNQSLFPLRTGIALCALLAMAGAASAQTVILSAAASSNLSVITIAGKALQPASGPPSVSLGSATLSLSTYNSVQIVANLPTGLKAGTYNLAVTGFSGTANFDVTIGAAGPTGPQGPPGPPFSLPFSGTVAAANNYAFTVTNTAGSGIGVAGVTGTGATIVGGVNQGSGNPAITATGGGGTSGVSYGGPVLSGTGGQGDNFGGDGIDGTLRPRR